MVALIETKRNQITDSLGDYDFLRLDLATLTSLAQSSYHSFL